MTVNPPSASVLVAAGVGGLGLLVAVGWWWLVKRAAPRDAGRFATFVGGWAALTWGLAQAGVFAQLDRRPPAFMLLPVGLVLGVAALGRSRIGAALATTPLWLLVGLQAFRLPLELVMHQAAAEGTMPRQMTFGAGGLNYDIVTGATAVLLAWALRRGAAPRALVLAWNVLGTGLLLVVVGVGIASTPLFARFGTEPAQLNTWVLFAPFVWLPALLVGGAALGHVVVFRALATGAGEALQAGVARAP